MEKLLKNSFYNRMFRFRELSDQRYRMKNLVDLTGIFLKKVTTCSTLMECFELHKDLWRKGYQNENLGPNPYGMFRTSDITRMRPSEVYLGNIYGLFTKSIPEWRRYEDEPIRGNGFNIDPETTIGELLVDQYKSLLRSNVIAIHEELQDWLDS